MRGGSGDIYRSLEDRKSTSKPVLLQQSDAARLEKELYGKDAYIAKEIANETSID